MGFKEEMVAVGGTGSDPSGRRGFMVPPLVLVAALYAGGCAAARFLSVTAGVAFLSALFTTLLAVIAYFYARNRNYPLIYALFFFLGVVGARLAIAEAVTPLTAWAERYAVVRGTVVAAPEVQEGEARYLLRVAEARVGEKRFSGGRLLLVVRGAEKVFGYGDVLTAKGFLRVPRTPGNPGEFDYATYLARRGVGVLLYARPEAVTRTGQGSPNPIVGAALWLRGRMFAALDALFPPEQSALVKGIAFGARTALDPLLNEAFRETGVVHILSVSGLHVGLVLGFVLGIARTIRLRSGITLLVSLLVLIFYDLMVGAGPPVVRATVMAVLFLWAKHLGRERDWPTALAVAALIILLANPLAVSDPGFQLSFAATWGILFLGPVVVSLLEGCGARLQRKVPPALAWGVAVPLGAQLGTLPLVTLYYGLVSPVAVLANILAVPLTGLILLFGLLAAIFGLFYLPLGEIMAAPTGLLLDLFTGLIRFFDRLPGAFFYLPTLPWGIVPLWYGFLYLAVLRLSGRPARVVVPGRSGLGPFLARTVVLVLVVVAWLGLFRWVGGMTPGLRVDFLDVGQGDSALVRTPGGGVILIDAGGWPGELEGKRPDGAGMRVVRYLRRQGVRHIDVLVLTHPHEDHCGGARAVVERLPVRLVVVPPLSRGIVPPYDRLLDDLRARGIHVCTAKGGDRIRLDPAVEVAVLGPLPVGKAPAAPTLNDASLVLRLRYKERSVLFAADVEQEGQGCLLRSGVRLQSDVLKVPHHGSAHFLPAFYQAVHPEVAVISVGTPNRFGQPAPEVLAALRRVGARLYRTDQDGAVFLRTDGHNLTVHPARRFLRRAA
ncbi:DNA internalization-related competence protein ComEC/Rec2 [Thermodesulfitimonas sp.]